MDDNRLGKRIFKWDKIENGPWMKDMFNMFSEYCFEEYIFIYL